MYDFKKYKFWILPTLLVCVLLILTSCNISKNGEAAYVDNAVIWEDEVTQEVQKFRESNNLMDYDTWHNYLRGQKKSASDIREKYLNDLIDKQVVKNIALDRNITVQDSEIENELNIAYTRYGSKEAFLNQINSAGTSYEQYCEELAYYLLQTKVEKALISESEASTKVLGQLLLTYSTKFDNSKGYYQLIARSDHAEIIQAYYQQITSGQISFEEAASQMTAQDKDKVNFDYVMYQCFIQNPQECTDVINNMQVGDISTPVAASGYVYLFKVVDKIECSNPLTSLSDLSSYTQDNIRYYAKVVGGDQVYQEALDKEKDKMTIKTYDMPPDLPYE